jgi:hypothetical protein
MLHSRYHVTLRVQLKSNLEQEKLLKSAKRDHRTWEVVIDCVFVRVQLRISGWIKHNVDVNLVPLGCVEVIYRVFVCLDSINRGTG